MNSDPKPLFILFGATCFLLLSAPLAVAQFYGDPPDDTHPWAIHDNNRPQPPRVEPGKVLGGAPSDAVILFNGSVASFKENWIHENEYQRCMRKLHNRLVTI